MFNPGGERRVKWMRALLLGTALASAAVIALPIGNSVAGDAEDIAALKKENAELRELVKGLAQDMKALKEDREQDRRSRSRPQGTGEDGVVGQ